MMMNRVTPLLLLLLLLAPLATACGNQTGHAGDHAYRLAPLVQMPPEVQDAPSTVREAYQFAVYNQHVLEELPCYCGCGAMGHVSNYSCYVRESGEAGADGGAIAYDNHALGCTICVDITQDAMRMLDEGHSVADIYAYVDATYSRFGPPTPLR
jgi:hypothetical protein